MWTGFNDRRDAGEQLASVLEPLGRARDVLVLGLPRGGVPVAYEVARRLGAPLDVCVVRKLGVPHREELAMGAIASGGVEVLNRRTIDELHVSSEAVQHVLARERHELERREQAYRGGRPPLDVRGRTVILVDDGLATGATMKAAVLATRQLGPARIVVAVPVAPASTCEQMRRLADDCVCLQTPQSFFGVGEWYAHFGQTSDDEVRALLTNGSRTDRDIAVR